VLKAKGPVRPAAKAKPKPKPKAKPKRR
jgi:hypothetical protein